MTRLYTMRQEPVLKTTVWGGRKLETMFNTPLPEGEKVGESWLLADHPHGTSRVANGPLAGAPLRQVVDEHGGDLFGGPVPPAWRERFPLLVKIIDAMDDLSVQVHPGPAYIQRHGIQDRAKAECWVILHADPGSRLITGLRPGTNARAFRRAAERGMLDDMLVVQEVGPGDALLIPAGRLHAIGAGIVLAEFQQPSDTTYRVYDWGRTDARGRSRQLHLDRAMDCIDFSGGFPEAGGRGLVDQGGGTLLESLVECDAFGVHRATVTAGVMERRLDHGFECVMITDGQGEVVSSLDDRPVRVVKGQAVVVPASAGAYELRSAVTMTALLGTVPKA